MSENSQPPLEQVGPPPVPDREKILSRYFKKDSTGEQPKPVWFSRPAVPDGAGPLLVKSLPSDAWGEWCKDGVICFGLLSFSGILKIYFANPRDQSVYHVADFDSAPMCRRFREQEQPGFILVGSKIYIIAADEVFFCDVASQPQLSGTTTGGYQWFPGPKLNARNPNPFLFSLAGSIYVLSLNQKNAVGSNVSFHVLNPDNENSEWIARSPPTGLGYVCGYFQDDKEKKFLLHTLSEKNEHVFSVYDAISDEWIRLEEPFDYSKLAAIFLADDIFSLLSKSKSFVLSSSNSAFGPKLVDYMGLDVGPLLHEYDNNADHVVWHLLPSGQRFCFLASYNEDNRAMEDVCFVRLGTFDVQSVNQQRDAKRRKLSETEHKETEHKVVSAADMKDIHKVVIADMKDIQLTDTSVPSHPFRFCSKSGAFSL